jgi:hypothetical protein
MSTSGAPAASVDHVITAGRAPNGFFRQGIVGGWRESLTEAQLDAVLSVAAPLLTELGYTAAGKVEMSGR